ncbi:MAG: hypothetical protein LLG03_17985, partial [Planctomycetaceae bacterium]|nr:hypothetical protein [Planctomycetaceae bacterium]
AAASNEQAQGIEQVNTAVGQMDTITQQNAATAEESASASEELSAQAEELTKMVGELLAMVGGSSKVAAAAATPHFAHGHKAPATAHKAAPATAHAGAPAATGWKNTKSHEGVTIPMESDAEAAKF